jgi:hypothetical protein
MSRMPEAINWLCFALLFHEIPEEEIANENIYLGLSKHVYDRRKEPENYLAGSTAAEQKVKVNIAKMEPFQHPQGKSFIQSPA